MCDHHTTITVCAESGDLPTGRCPALGSRVITITPESDSYTDDTAVSGRGYCQLPHDPNAAVPPEGGEGTGGDTPAPATGIVGPGANLSAPTSGGPTTRP